MYQPPAQQPAEPAAFQQLTREISCPNAYIKMQLSFPKATGVDASRKLMADVLQAALTQLHGHVGGALPCELLQYHSTHNGGIGVFRLAKKDATTAVSAAACITCYGDHAVRLAVLSMSPFLSAMASDSRAWQQTLAASLPAA